MKGKKKFEFRIRADWKALVLGVLIVALVIALPFMFSKMQIFGAKESFESKAILKATEDVGELALVKMKFQKVLDPSIVPVILGTEVPLFESKALVIVTSEASACIDLTKLTGDRIVFGDDIITLKIERPYICNERLIMNDSKKYDVNLIASLFHPDLPDEAIKRAEKEIPGEAEDSGILEMAEVQAKAFLSAMLSSISERKVVVEFTR